MLITNKSFSDRYVLGGDEVTTEVEKQWLQTNEISLSVAAGIKESG